MTLFFLQGVYVDAWRAGRWKEAWERGVNALVTSTIPSKVDPLLKENLQSVFRTFLKSVDSQRLLAQSDIQAISPYSDSVLL